MMEKIFTLFMVALFAALVLPLGASYAKASLMQNRGVAFNERTVAFNGRVIAIPNRMEEALVPAWDNNYVPKRITAANDALFSEANAQQRLTDYANGYRDPADIDAACEFFAPAVSAPTFFEYEEFSKAEEFYSDGADDDLRAPRGDFPEVEYTSETKIGKLDNRGLMIVIDHNSEDMSGDWQTRHVSKLMRRLGRNKLRRAMSLLSAAATNTNVVWAAGVANVDPDQAVAAELLVGTDVEGVAPNRVGYGQTAWSRRRAAIRGLNNAGGYSSMPMSKEDLAGDLEVDQVYVAKERYSTGGAVAQVLNDKTLMFHALSGADREDASNIKDFYKNSSQGGRYGVFVWEIQPKKTAIAVEHYEKQVITSPLGIRQFTVNAS